MTDRPPEFDAAVIELRPRLHAFAMGLTKNASEAEDAVSSTLVRAFGSWEQYQPGTNLGAWLFTILRNAVYDRARRKKRVVEDPDEVQAMKLAVNPAQLATIELRETLERMKDLDFIQQKCLSLVVDGYQYEEISEMIGVPVGTVKSQVSRAREYLENSESLALEPEPEPTVRPRDREAIVRLFRAGSSVSDICSQLSVDRSVVRDVTMELTLSGSRHA